MHSIDKLCKEVPFWIRFAVLVERTLLAVHRAYPRKGRREVRKD